MKQSLVLAGGWGYNNLGDEAILAGYLAELGAEFGDRRIIVSSVDPKRSGAAQESDAVEFVREGHANVGGREISDLILGGGGYLNGQWQPEVTLKLGRLLRDRGNAPALLHGVEVRAVERWPSQGRMRRLVEGSALGVRDNASASELGRLGRKDVEVLPDSIALMAPHWERFVSGPGLRGKVLLNLMDFSERGDSHEAELELGGWVPFCRALVSALGDRAVCMIVGGGDYRFARSLGSVNIFAPRTVRELISGIATSDAIFSVRMHPALLGSMLSVPTVSVPYCGKVRPTLSRIGIERLILAELSVERTIEALKHDPDAGDEWRTAHARSTSWIHSRLA